MIFGDALTDAYKLGHSNNPEFPDTHGITLADVQTLREGDELARQMLESRSRFQAIEYAQAVYCHHGRLQPEYDGGWGPAAREIAELPRCRVPDFAPPQWRIDADEADGLSPEEWEVAKSLAEPTTGVGNWKSCHGIGNFHSATVGVNRANIGSHLTPVFDQVLKNVQSAYAEIGLLFRFIENGKDMLTGDVFDGVINHYQVRTLGGH